MQFKFRTMHPGDYLVPFDGTFTIQNAVTAPPENGKTDKDLRKSLKQENNKLYELQRRLYAQNQYSVLLIFQAMDAAGKDSTIRHVMRGVNPAGCQVFSFKQPSKVIMKKPWWSGFIRSIWQTSDYQMKSIW
jgi:polyphosphate kinase 2 (PPK2 family)